MSNTWVGYVKKGFTIVELVIVVSVIGILATVILVSYNGVRYEADKQMASASLKEMQDAIDVWRLSSNGAIPADLSEVDVEIPTDVTAEYWRYDQNTQFCLSASTISGASYYRNSHQSGAPVEGRCSDVASVTGAALALNSTQGTQVPMTSTISGTPDITFYGVFDIIDAASNYDGVAELGPNSATNRVRFQTSGAGVANIGYRIDTPLQTNQTSAQTGVRTAGKHIGWIQLRDSLTTREFAYDKATAHTSLTLTPSTLNFSTLALSTATASTTPIATVAYNAAHDETTRARVMQWLATKYSVPLTF